MNDGKPKQQRRERVSKQNERCCICRRHTRVIVIRASESHEAIYFVCRECDRFFLKGLYGFEKGLVLIKALKVSEEEKLYLPYALNAIRNRYTLQEARRRTRLREREQLGKTTDLYNLGQRMPGSFGSRQ
jgi:hypothetical protein